MPPKCWLWSQLDLTQMNSNKNKLQQFIWKYSFKKKQKNTPNNIATSCQITNPILYLYFLFFIFNILILWKFIIFMDSQLSLQPISVDPRAYRFFPNQKEQKTSFDKKGTRFFFYGQIQHDEYEKGKLAEFQQFLTKNKYQLNRQYWTNQKTLQFLSGNGYKNEQCYQAITAHEKFKEEYIGPEREKVQLDPIAYLINNGMFYPCGRDKNFRPILVFNAKKIDMKDFEASLKATIFVHEQIIQNMFLPGQVESWVIIYDLAGMGITQIPTGILKNMLQKMSLNYGGRLYRLWVVNAPMTITFSWKIVSAFLDQVTVDKIKISKSSTEKDMWNLCDKSQVEQKYGGTQPNRTSYWPFSVPEGKFDEARLISDQQYQKKIEKGELKRNTLNPKYC